MKHVAPLRYDVIFKKAFSVPEIFSAFVSDVLGTPVQVERVETEKRFSEPIGPINSRFDLYAEDTIRRMIVDIQHQRYPDHYERFLYYHCVAIVQQTVSSKDYRVGLQVVTVVILTSGDWHNVDVAMIDFDPKDRHGRSLDEIRHKIIFLCPKYVQDDTPPALRVWMQAMEDTLDEEVDETIYPPTIQRVFDLIEQDRLTPQERARMKDEYSQQALLEQERQLLEQERQKSLEEREAREQAEREAERAQQEAERAQQEAERVREEMKRLSEEKEREAQQAQEQIANLLARLQALENNKEPQEE